MRSLLTPRWAGRLLAMLAAVALCVVAGRWQWSRFEESSSRNAAVEASQNGPAVPLEDVLQPGGPAPEATEFRLVEARGRYDPDHLLVIRLRPRDGVTGAEELVPLRTAGGAALLVNRGWYAADADGSTPPPPPPSGEVTVQARLTMPETGRGPGGDPADGSIRFLDVEALRSFYPYPVYGGYGALVREQPSPPGAPRPPEVPSFSTGLHLAYTVQWYLFSGLCVLALVLVARNELRARRRPDGGADGPDDGPPGPDGEPEPNPATTTSRPG